MCGITGFFNPAGISKNFASIINKMTDSLIHRGPDDKGIFFDDYCALGHTRLAIIDLEGGKQPMSDEKNRVIIVFNGEIYNFLKLKKILVEQGYNFKTNSDTEVIINAYLYWGEKFIERLNGMFAIAIYDKKLKSIFLYRDRIGLKPLYYTFYKNILIFGSEPKAIFSYSDKISRKVNIKALSNYLSTHNINFKDETLFDNLKILEPGSLLKYNSNGYKIEKYWDISVDIKDYNFDYLKEIFYEKLKKSTEMRLISDVPLGAYLSGGVDSTVLISIIKDKFKKNLKTFTIGFEKKEFNEFYFSDLVNKIFTTDNEKVIFPEKDYFDILETYLKIKDFPLNVPNEVLIYYLSKYLKKYITVVVSGEGSDEILGGYGLFLRSVHDFIKIFILKNCPDFFSEEINGFIKTNLSKYYKNINFYSLEHFVYNIYSVFSLEEKKFLLNKEFFKQIEQDLFLMDEFKNILNTNEELTFYDKFLYFLEKFHLPGLLLRLDNATMAAGVEARAPFTDYEFVDFCFTIPFYYKIKWKDPKFQLDAVIENARTISEHFDITKFILKETFKNEIPPEIYNRNKWSFPVPLNDFFNNEFKSYIISKFEKESIFYEFFNFKNVNSYIKEVHYGNKGLKTWMLLNLKIWMENFIH